jgi:hypothetical protein
MAKKAITITVDKQVILDAKKRAEHNNRPFSNHIEWLLIKDIREGEKNNKITPTELD